MQFLKQQVSKIIDYFLRRRWLYKSVGWGAFLAMIAELTSFDLENYYKLDFTKLEAKYGQEITAVIAYIVDKLANGPDYINVSIALILVVICLYIDFKVSTKDSNKKTVWNLFFGLNQNINQNFKD